MNIYKAKVVYFKHIKLMLTQALELIEKEHKHPKRNLRKDFIQVEKEIRILLDARNG